MEIKIRLCDLVDGDVFTKVGGTTEFTKVKELRVQEKGSPSSFVKAEEGTCFGIPESGTTISCFKEETRVMFCTTLEELVCREEERNSK